MKFLTNVALLFYVSLISFVSTLAILFCSHVLMLQDVTYYLGVVYMDLHLRWIIAGINAALIFLSYVLARFIAGIRQKERTIAFHNPAGLVTVSLGAVEDLVVRLVYKLPEIKEVRSYIIKTKKGIEVDSRLVLKTDVNLPEMTSRLQDMIKAKILEILGVDEPVIVRIHVVKIASDGAKDNQKKESIEDKMHTVPFQGYRR